MGRMKSWLRLKLVKLLRGGRSLTMYRTPDSDWEVLSAGFEERSTGEMVGRFRLTFYPEKNIPLPPGAMSMIRTGILVKLGEGPPLVTLSTLVDDSGTILDVKPVQVFNPREDTEIIFIVQNLLEEAVTMKAGDYAFDMHTTLDALDVKRGSIGVE